MDIPLRNSQMLLLGTRTPQIFRWWLENSTNPKPPKYSLSSWLVCFLCWGWGGGQCMTSGLQWQEVTILWSEQFLTCLDMGKGKSRLPHSLGLEVNCPAVACYLHSSAVCQHRAQKASEPTNWLSSHLRLMVNLRALRLGWLNLESIMPVLSNA